MPDHDSHHGYIANKDDYLKRLRRIEGQARGLQKMIEEEQNWLEGALRPRTESSSRTCGIKPPLIRPMSRWSRPRNRLERGWRMNSSPSTFGPLPMPSVRSPGQLQRMKSWNRSFRRFVSESRESHRVASV